MGQRTGVAGIRVRAAAADKPLLVSALEDEMGYRLGCDRHDPAGDSGGNSRNDKRSKTVVRDVGPVGAGGAAGAIMSAIIGPGPLLHPRSAGRQGVLLWVW